MKVLALNGSPRMKASSTYHMLKPLLEGMEEAGAETKLVHIRKLNLEVCIGCYTCWVRTPGKCIHKDKDQMIAMTEQIPQEEVAMMIEINQDLCTDCGICGDVCPRHFS